MTVARSQLVDTNVTPWYHVISGTVRGTLLLGEGGESRKQWIENRLEELASIFAIDVAGFRRVRDIAGSSSRSWTEECAIPAGDAGSHKLRNLLQHNADGVSTRQRQENACNAAYLH